MKYPDPILMNMSNAEYHAKEDILLLVNNIIDEYFTSCDLEGDEDHENLG